MTAALVVLFLGLSAVTRAETPTDPTSLRIRTIKVTRSNVFLPAAAQSNRTARLANGFHVLTRERVVRRELLFSEGDEVDTDLLAASERRLRGLGIFSDADITTETVSNETVDVLVHVHDQWSLIPGFNVGGGGGILELGLTLHDYNIFGRGEHLFVQALHETDVGTTWAAGFDDPQFLDTHWVLDGGLATGPLIESVAMALTRPFYGPDVMHAYGLSGFWYDAIIREFEGGEEVSRYREEAAGGNIHYTRAFGKRFAKNKVGLSYGVDDRRVSDLGSLTTQDIPADELVAETTLSLSHGVKRYVRDRRINGLRRLEDIKLGRKTSLSVGRAGFPIPVGVRRWDLAASHSENFTAGKSRYLRLKAEVSSLIIRDTIVTARGRYYDRIAERLTLAAHIKLDVARDLEAGSQLLLGGDSGLRGYPAREFAGDKRLQMNLETRWFPRFKLLSIEVGPVAFIDSGYVWQEGQSIDLADLRYSAGFGLRLGASKFAGSPMLRLDAGYAFDDLGHYPFSLGFGQLF